MTAFKHRPERSQLCRTGSVRTFDLRRDGKEDGLTTASETTRPLTEIACQPAHSTRFGIARPGDGGAGAGASGGRASFDLADERHIEQTHTVTFRGVHDENASVG